MSGILDPFLESIQNLPCNVHRNLHLITNLEEKVQELVKTADELCEAYIAKAATLSPDEKNTEMQKVAAIYDKALHLSEEKTQLSQQTYNLVDKQITQIDDEIEKVKEKQANSDAASEKTAHGGSNKDGKRGRKKTKAFDSAADVIIEGMCLNMEIDPNEPRYCTCQQVSYGEMIGCDEKDCPFEWFHFPCVNLKSKPKGKWYCETCTKKRNSKTTT